MTHTKLHTAAYTRIHGRPPWHTQGKGLWAFTLDAQEQVTVTYGTWREARAWALAQAQYTVTLLP